MMESAEGTSHTPLCPTWVGDPQELTVPPWSSTDLFAHHFATIRDAASQMERPGWVLAVTHNNEELVTTKTVPMRPGDEEFLILGRHPRCDVQCSDDPTVPRRAVVLRLFRSRDGTLSATSLQLGRYRICIDGVESARCVEVEGGLCLRLSSYAIWCVPIANPQLAEDPNLMLSRISTRTVVVAKTQGFDATTVAEIDVPDHVRYAPVGMTRNRTSTLAGDTVGVLRIQTVGCERAVPITRSRLRTGISIGRSDSCDVPVPSSPVISGISSVHVLLWKPGSMILAIDTASGEGLVNIDGERETVASLHGDSFVDIGPGTRLIWEPFPEGLDSPTCFTPPGGFWTLK